MSNNKNLKYKVFVSYSRKDKDLVHSFIGLGDNREFDWIKLLVVIHKILQNFLYSAQ